MRFRVAGQAGHVAHYVADSAARNSLYVTASAAGRTYLTRIHRLSRGVEADRLVLAVAWGSAILLRVSAVLGRVR